MDLVGFGKLLTSASALLAMQLSAQAIAQSGQLMPRVGVLVPQALPQGWEGKEFRDALHKLGHREGVNLVLDIRSADARVDRLPALAVELVRSGAQVIVAMNTPGTRAAMGATRTVPIVMVEVGDPVGTGFVNNLARPEGNVTGISNMCGELADKRLSILKEAVPRAKRIAVMLNPDDPITVAQVKDAERTAPSLGVEVRIFQVRAISELEAVTGEALAWRADAAMWLCGQQGALERRSASLGIKHRLPVMSYQFVPGDGLVSYTPNRKESFRRAAVYVDKILKGAKPADLPVEQPTRFDLIVNLRAARSIGLTVPQTVLLRADRVID